MAHPVEAIIDEIAREYGVERSFFCRPGRAGLKATGIRALIAHRCKDRPKFSSVDLGARLRIDHSTVCHYLHNVSPERALMFAAKPVPKAEQRRKRRHIKDELRKAIRDAARSGERRTDIAKRLGVTYDSVRKYAAGIKGPPPLPVLTERQRDYGPKIERMRSAGMTWPAIATAFRLSSDDKARGLFNRYRRNLKRIADYERLFCMGPQDRMEEQSVSTADFPYAAERGSGRVAQGCSIHSGAS